jgi:hypothetical protein
MKKTMMIALLALSFQAFSATKLEEATSLFDQRGEDRNFAKQSAEMFKELANSATDKQTKAQMKVSESRAYYFFGRTALNKNDKKSIYVMGYEAATTAINLLQGTGLNKDLAYAHYYYAINLGKWGEANGALSSLGKWPELRSQLDIIDSLGEEAKAIESYGSMRTRGRALHKLPFSSKSEALKNLKFSFENSFADGFDMSASTTTTLYYLDILVKTNSDADTFCEVYEMMLDLADLDDEELKEELTDLNPALVPEGMIEVRQFTSGAIFEEDVHGYADNKCDL